MEGATPSKAERKEEEEEEKEQGMVVERRDFLKAAVATSVVLAAVGVAAVGKSIANPGSPSGGAASAAFPRVKVANVSDLVLNKPVIFNYPLDNEPNLLVKLGVKAKDGAGADGDIVAFSQICQHLGCVYGFQSPGTSPPCAPTYTTDKAVGYCCCHGSTYDFANGAQVIGGPSPRPLPRVMLEVDSSGAIFATGMTPPTIFGHETGSQDVSADLQGGNPVGQG